MRSNIHLPLLGALLLVAAAPAAVVDRVAIVIGKTVITEGELLDDLRLTQFINNEPLDLGPAARRAAAEHLIDQNLIHQELELSGYTTTPPGEADGLLRTFRQNRFHSLAAYQAALRKYGVTDEQVKHRLLWQLTAVRFIDFRFGTGKSEPVPQSADRAAAGAPATTVDQQMDAWLKQARADNKVTLKPEAFE